MRYTFVGIMLGACGTLCAQLKPNQYSRIFFADHRVACIDEHSVEFYAIPAGTSATVDGRPMKGELALSGTFEIKPGRGVSKVITFAESISPQSDPSRNGERFVLCTHPPAIARPGNAKSGFSKDRFCGVMDVSGKVVFDAPSPQKNEYVEALALTLDGREALFVYGQGKNDEEYLVWSQRKGIERMKADLKSTKVRQILQRFGLERSEGE